MKLKTDQRCLQLKADKLDLRSELSQINRRISCSFRFLACVIWASFMAARFAALRPRTSIRWLPKYLISRSANCAGDLKHMILRGKTHSRSGCHASICTCIA